MTLVVESPQVLHPDNRIILHPNSLIALQYAIDDAQNFNGNQIDTTSLVIGLMLQGDAIPPKILSKKVSKIIKNIREFRMSITNKEPYSRNLSIDPTADAAIRFAVLMGYATDILVGPIHLGESLKRSSGLHTNILQNLGYSPKSLFKKLTEYPDIQSLLN